MVILSNTWAKLPLFFPHATDSRPANAKESLWCVAILVTIVEVAQTLEKD